jgi:DNA-directed RNA polymerase alpha subunit
MNNQTKQVRETKIISPHPQRYDVLPVLNVSANTMAQARIKVIENSQGTWVLYEDVKTFLDNKLTSNLHKSIEEIGLSTHAVNVLKKLNAKTVKDVTELEKPYGTLLKYRGMGFKTNNEIISKIYQ